MKDARSHLRTLWGILLWLVVAAGWAALAGFVALLILIAATLVMSAVGW